MTQNLKTNRFPGNRRGAASRAWSFATCILATASLLTLSCLVAGTAPALAASTTVARPAVAAAKPSTTASRKAAARALAARRAKARIAPKNVAMKPNVLRSCNSTSISTTCVSEEIAAINNARVAEGITPISINIAHFAELSAVEQVFAVTDLERSARGLPVVAALTTQLNTAAAVGTTKSVDPALVGWTLTGGKNVTAWASNWAGGLDALGSDYVWMYDDGVGYNVDCPTVAAAGCWGHRDNVLIPGPVAASCANSGAKPELEMGAAVLSSSYKGATGIGEIFVTSCGGLPVDATFTWAEAQRDLLS